MKKIFFILTLLLAMPAAAQFQNPVKFTTSQKVNGDELEVTFTGKIDAGWHVYTADNSDDGPQKAEVTLDKIEGLTKKGGIITKGNVHKAMDDMFGMEVSYVEGTVTFVQKFTITAEKYEVAGYLTYGACNDQNCIPPTDVDFTFSGTAELAKKNDKAEKAEPTKEEKVKEEKTETPAEETVAEEVEPVVEPLATDTIPTDTLAEKAEPAATGLWTPVIDELKKYGEENNMDSGLLGIFLLGLVGGLVALFTPCVWPIIPMTVSFFLKRNKDNKQKGIRDAATYGLSIVVIYVALGLVITGLFGASALNSLSTNAVFNIFFFLMLLVFAASFFGWFELTLPSKWSNAVDSKAEKTTGLLSIFLMAFTLSLVSFSCTGPIIGFLLVEVGTSGNIIGPAIGMLGFAIALALPFTLFAMFPAWLKSAPKSGNWMNCLKVCLGFLELAFSLKFLSVADMAYGWHLLDRETFLCLWIMLFALLGAYLMKWFRFPHDEDEYDDMGEVVVHERVAVPRFFLALISFAFALYMVPGLWGAPCKAISAFAPPMSTQDFKLGDMSVEATFTDYEEGMDYAKKHNMPVMLDFTGFGCVNCREMESKVWADERVKSIMTEKYVLISLYVDDKTDLPQDKVISNASGKQLKTVGKKWSYLQEVKFGTNTQPFYVLLDNEGHPLNKSYSHDTDVDKFVEWLNTGLKNYKR